MAIENPNIDLHGELMFALHAQNRKQLAEIFRQFPNSNLQSALTFLEANEHVYDLSALDCLATASVHSGDYVKGLGYATTTLVWGYQLVTAGVHLPEADIEFTLGNSSFLLQKLFLETGQYQAGIEQYELLATLNLPGWYKPLYVSTHLQAAENYLEHNQVDRAEEIVLTIQQEIVPPVSRVLYDRLKNKIRLLKSETHASPEEVAQYKQKQQLQDLKNMLASLQEVMKGHEDLTDMEAIEELIHTIEKEGSISDLKLTELSNRISSQIIESQAILSGSDNLKDSTQIQRHNLLQDIAFFHDKNKGHEQELLEAVSDKLKIYKDWFESKNLISDVIFVAWCQYICSNRLNNHEEAAEFLQIVYEHLEKQRASIADIHKRAGVFKQYPELFGAMAFQNYQSENSWGLFNCIEASKGRNLADKTLEAIGDQTESNGLENLRVTLIPLLAKYNAHYLTILTDYERSYAVLLTKAGRLFATADCPSEVEISDWIKKDYPSPSSWNVPISGLFGKKKRIAISEELGKFLIPVNYAIKEGIIKKDDHLVYSSDGPLNLFALHFAKLETGQALIEQLSVSKIHSGFQLSTLLSRQLGNIENIIGISCSAVQDDPVKVEAFEEISHYLVPGEKVNEIKDTSVSAVLESFQPNHLYHLATHGVFPKISNELEMKFANPYYNSGLLLMHDGNKPELDVSFRYFDSPHLLNPEKLTKSQINLEGSHVSMQACVSGRAKEGYGGDALGLEWAFFYCGAQSLISAGWDIDVNWSNKLFAAFYKYYLKDSMSLAQAHRKALLEVKQQAPSMPFPQEYYWAGLSLIGDFR